MRIVAIIAAISIVASSFGQGSIDSVLVIVERNNTTLTFYRKNADAEKIANKTGLYPRNPEAEFNYLLGNPSAIGNRTDFIIKQSFDFPTAYSYKSQISNLKNEQAELEYKKQRNEILFQTHVILIKLIYKNALNAANNKLYSNALQIANAYKTKFDKGDIGILEYNKAQVNLLNITKEIENNEIEKNAFLLELYMLNGGIPIIFSDSVFTWQSIPDNFEQWYVQTESHNPLLQWLKHEIAISEKQNQLNVAMSLPKLYAGYMSEKVVGQQFQGITVGISIPLWENKNTGKYAKAKTVAIRSMETDVKLQFYNNLKATYAKAIALQSSVSDYRSKLKSFSNDELLYKAFSMGEISLTEYMYELSLYFDSYNKLLEMEMNLNLIIAELKKYNK